MASQLRRASFVRWVVGGIVLALPLFGAGSAAAAMGGAIPLTSSLRPDLTSVTLVTPNAAEFCFDKTLDQAAGPLTPNKADFVLGGYNPNANTSAPANLLTTEPTQVQYKSFPVTNCVDAVYPVNNPIPTGPGAPIDYSQYTYGSVSAGAVSSGSLSIVNDADSTTLTGSTTNNGTTGNTVAPDLLSVTVSGQVASYVFNKNISAVTVVPSTSGFFIVDAGGNVCHDTSAADVTWLANTVKVHFPSACPGIPASDGTAAAFAVRAGVDVGVVGNTTAGGETNPDTQVQAVAGTSGTTSDPDLVSAVLEPDGSAIDYNFNKPIGAVPTPIAFGAALSNGTVAEGLGTQITNTTTSGTVRVTFAGSTNFNEYLVKATVGLGGATALGNLNPTTAGSVPVGDNAGAFARGFTSGPDATGVTFNSVLNQLTFTFDQRIAATPTVPAGFVLLDPNGTPVASGVGQSVSVVPSAAGSVQVTVHFLSGLIGSARAVEICGPPDNDAAFAAPTECTAAAATGGSVFTSSGLAVPQPPTTATAAEPNVQQILSPFAVSSVRLNKVSGAHWKHAVSVKHVKQPKKAKHSKHSSKHNKR